MAINFKDRTGQKFGYLTALYIAGQDDKKRFIWHCKCECGNEIDVLGSYLSNDSKDNCGCKTKEKLSKTRIKTNTYDIKSQEYGIGYTLKGEPFYFDIEDYDLIRNYCWRLRKDGYLDAKKRDGSGKRVLMHNLIFGDKYIDHINHCRNDNRKQNLRKPDNNCDSSFDTCNQMNKELQSNNNSGVTGVYWHKRDSVWEVYIDKDNQRTYLGRYNDFNKAVKIRKEAEDKYFGELSYDNSIKYANENITKIGEM